MTQYWACNDRPKKSCQQLWSDLIKHSILRFPVLFDGLKNYSYPKYFPINILDNLVVWQLLVVASTWTNGHLIPASCQSPKVGKGTKCSPWPVQQELLYDPSDQLASLAAKQKNTHGDRGFEILKTLNASCEGTCFSAITAITALCREACLMELTIVILLLGVQKSDTRV